MGAKVRRSQRNLSLPFEIKTYNEITPNGRRVEKDGGGGRGFPRLKKEHTPERLAIVDRGCSARNRGKRKGIACFINTCVKGGRGTGKHRLTPPLKRDGGKMEGVIRSEPKIKEDNSNNQKKGEKGREKEVERGMIGIP